MNLALPIEVIKRIEIIKGPASRLVKMLLQAL
jgi:outer membrane receptor for ferrienterochelin and colicin